MDNFLEYIQPTIIRAAYNESLPENVKGKFFINLNIFGIQYFSEISNIIDIPRMYIYINDKFVNENRNNLQSFISQALIDNSLFISGNETFVYNEDYYINETLWNYLYRQNLITNENYPIPNYINENGLNTEYWIDFSTENYKDYTNILFFNKKNNILDFVFSEDELNNFYSTFCHLILDNTEISDTVKNSGNNIIYNLVLNYYANFKNDYSSTALQLILGSLYTTTNKVTNCGCNNISESTLYSNLSCYDMYSEAMITWLKTMLGDKSFYEDWFFIKLNDDEKIPNENLIDILKLLINEFLKLEHNLVSTKKPIHNCGCPNIETNENNCIKSILNNFLNVLEYVATQEIDKNKNKIKIYGEQFGELLPKLQF